MITKKSKIFVSVFAGVLLILLYWFIFSMSEQDGEKSSTLSHAVSEKCVEIVDTVARKHWTDVVKAEMANLFEHPVRKIAHFSEYACMGVLLYILWYPWLGKCRKLYLLCAVWVLCSAALDEFHQLFVSGRDGNLIDVCIDTSGGIFGLMLTHLLDKIYWKIRKNKENKKK